MNCKFPLPLLVLGLMVLTGCAAHNPKGIRTVLEPSCLLAPIVIEGCDAAGDSVHCRKVKIRYRPGCEKIEVVKAQK